MRTEYLEELVTLARYLNFTETASMLNISQPTLSKHISSLERELKAPLFERNGTFLTLTKSGKMVLPHAFSIIEAHEAMLKAAKEGMSSFAPHLKIGGNVGLRTVLSIVQRLSYELREKYGSNVIEISDIETEGEYRNFTRKDMGKTVDLFFTYLDESDAVDERTEVRSLLKVPLSIIVDGGHELARKEKVMLTDLENETFIRLEGNVISEAWRFLKSACAKAEFAIKCRHVYFPHITDLLEITSSIDSDILVMSDDYIEQFRAFISPNCTVIPIDDPQSYLPLSIVYSLDNPNSLIDEALDFIFKKSACHADVGRE